MNITNYERNRLVDHSFGGVSASPVANWYIGLSTTVIDETGNTVTEPSSGDGYARKAIPNDKSNWTTSASGVVTNASAIVLDESTASWGTIVSIFLADSLTGGNVCYFQTASPTFPVVASTEITFEAGTITATIT